MLGFARYEFPVGPVSDFTEPVDGYRARQAVAGFALVEFLTGRAA
jgi:hypothetical protein